ncbi:MAG: hypothetical protein ACI89L_001052 [Phycisphaerales bacterium]|jgi:hypothetical protein
MRRIQAIVATSGVDSQGEAIDPAEIRRFCEEYGDVAVPLLLEHDWRRYIGRSVNGELTEVRPGEIGLLRTLEYFESSDDLPPLHPTLRVLEETPRAGITVEFDPHHSDDEASSLFHDINRSLESSRLDVRHKTGLSDPALVYGAICVGSILLHEVAKGILGGVSSDAYQGLKACVLSWCSRPEATARVVQFRVILETESRSIAVRVYVHSNAVGGSAAKYDAIWQRLVEEIQAFSLDLSEIGFVICEYDESGFSIVQAVRVDGVPLIKQSIPKYDSRMTGMSVGFIAKKIERLDDWPGAPD